MTDITELAQRVKTETAAIDDTQWYLAKPSEIRSLVEALEKAQQERENWRTSFDNERLRADKLKAHIDEMTEERTASINELSRIIQREIKAKREAEQRIAELEDAEQKLCAANVTLDARADLAERQLAAMDSETVADDGIYMPDDAVGVFNVGCETCPDHLVAWTVKGQNLPAGNYWLYISQQPAPVVPDGWVMVPKEPTERMVIDGFESEPDETFSEPEVWEAYQKMSGCEQAAYRVRLCWAAMLTAAPQEVK